MKSVWDWSDAAGQVVEAVNASLKNWLTSAKMQALCVLIAIDAADFLLHWTTVRYPTFHYLICSVFLWTIFIRVKCNLVKFTTVFPILHPHQNHKVQI